MLRFLTFLTVLVWTGLSTGQAAVITSSGTAGSWEQPSSWLGGTVPGAGDTVRIAGGSNLVISGSVSLQRMIFLNDTASSSVRLSQSATLNVSEDLILGFPLRDNRSVILNADSGSLVLNNVSYSMSSSDSRRTIIRVGTGSMVVSGIFNMNPADYGYNRRRLEIVDAGSVVFQGVIQNPSSFFNAPGSSVSYLASGDFSLLSGDYHHLSVIGSGVKTIGTSVVNGKTRLGGGTLLSLKGNLSLRDSILLSGAVIRQNNFNLTLAGNFALSGSFGSANHFDQNGTGNLIVVGDSAQRFLGTFPVGANGKYAPFTVEELACNFPGNPGSRNLIIKTFGVAHPLDSGTNQVANRFWRLSSNNLTVVTRFKGRFSYSDDDVAAPLNEADFTRAARFRNGVWQVNFPGGSVNASTNELLFDTLNNVIDGDYTLGSTSGFPTNFPFVVSIRNGDWTTSGNWSTGSVPTAAQNVVVMHSLDGFNGSCANLTIESMGSLTARQNNTTINGNLIVKGAFNDAHSGGTNTILGTIRVENGGNFIGSGSGGGTSYTFANDIENHGNWSVFSSTIRFTRQVKNTIRLFGTRPVNFTRSEGSIRTLVDTLWLDFDTPAGIPASFDPNFWIGDTLHDFNCIVVNKTAIRLNNLTSLSSGSFVRMFVQGANAYLGLNGPVPFAGTDGILDATASGNTVDYRQGGSNQNIKAINYHHLTLNSDRSDRSKTLGSGVDITVAGNLTVNNDAATLQFSTNSNGQRLTILGDLILNGNGNFRTTSGQNVRNFLAIGGKIINNNNGGMGINAKLNDTTYTIVTLNGSGIVAEGSGNSKFRDLILSGSDTMRWVSTGTLEISDTLLNNAGGFIQEKGRIFIPNSSRFTMKGSSPLTRFRYIQFTDRADRNVSVFQRLNLEVDSLFHMNADGRTTLGAFYDFAGQWLKINGEFRAGTNGGSSALRGDSLSTFEISGSAPTSGLALAAGFRRLGVLIHNKPANPLSIGQPLSLHQRLDLFNGILNGSGNIRMMQGSTVRRTDGSIPAAFNNTSGRYNVEYWKGLTSGPEVLGNQTLGRLVIKAPAGDTVTIGNTPSLDSNLVYESGQIRASGNNYIRLNSTSFLELGSTTSGQLVFPVGTPTVPSFLAVELSGISSGKALLKPFRAEAPNIPSDANVRVNRYVEIGGNATGLNLNLGFNYLDADLTGDETFLQAQFWNGTAWSSSNGTVLAPQNGVAMSGISGNGILTAFGTFVKIQDPIVQNQDVFPNPTRGQVHIATRKSIQSMELRDVLGKQVEFGKTGTAEGYRLDLSGLPKGVYFLNLNTRDENQIIRLVKE